MIGERKAKLRVQAAGVKVVIDGCCALKIRSRIHCQIDISPAAVNDVADNRHFSRTVDGATGQYIAAGRHFRYPDSDSIVVGFNRCVTTQIDDAALLNHNARSVAGSCHVDVHVAGINNACAGKTVIAYSRKPVGIGSVHNDVGIGDINS